MRRFDKTHRIGTQRKQRLAARDLPGPGRGRRVSKGQIASGAFPTWPLDIVRDRSTLV